MPNSTYLVLPFSKVGLESEEGFVIVRGGIGYLRVLGGEPRWLLMTATADEDHGRILVCQDRVRLAAAARQLCNEIGVTPSVELDRAGREYVVICEIERKPGEAERAFDEANDFLFTKFFAIFDGLADTGAASGSEMRRLYQDLAVSDRDEDVYLTDGVWLRSDGSLDDRGR